MFASPRTNSHVTTATPMFSADSTSPHCLVSLSIKKHIHQDLQPFSPLLSPVYLTFSQHPNIKETHSIELILQPHNDVLGPLSSANPRPRPRTSRPHLRIPNAVPTRATGPRTYETDGWKWEAELARKHCRSGQPHYCRWPCICAWEREGEETAKEILMDRVGRRGRAVLRGCLLRVRHS